CWMETNEISEWYITPCFVNGEEAFDGEVNLAFDENLISNEFAVKLCLDYELIINLEEDDFVSVVILGRSFRRIATGIADFGNRVITIYLEPDPFEDDSRKTGKISDDWDQLLNFDFDGVPKFEEELPLFVCKMRKTAITKKRAMENLNLFYHYMGPSLGAWVHLTQEEVVKEALILNEILKDNVELDGKTMKEDEEAVRSIKDTGSDINTMPYRIFETLGIKDMKKTDRGITMINHTQAKAMGKLLNVLFKLNILNTSERIFSTFDGNFPQTFRAARFDVLRKAESDSDDEEEYVIKRNKFGAPIYGP
nr:hypothetical protein [Tanacetum cinerariifolium]